MFVILTCEKMFPTGFKHMFMVYLHTTFQMPISSSSLMIFIIEKVNYRFCMPPCSRGHILQKYDTKKVGIFRRSVTTQNFSALH
jgi:hypothetical protein